MNAGDYGMLNVPTSFASSSGLSSKEMNDMGLLSEEDAKLLNSCMEDIVQDDGQLDGGLALGNLGNLEEFFDFAPMNDVGSPALNSGLNRNNSIDISPGLNERMSGRMAGESSQSQNQAVLQSQQQLSQQGVSQQQSAFLQADSLMSLQPIDLDMGGQHDELLASNRHRMMSQSSLLGQMPNRLNQRMRTMVMRQRRPGMTGLMQPQSNYRLQSILDDEGYLDDGWMPTSQQQQQQQQRMEAFAAGQGMRAAMQKQLQQRVNNPMMHRHRQLQMQQQMQLRQQAVLANMMNGGSGRQGLPQLSRRLSTGAPHLNLMQRSRSVDYLSPSLLSSKSMQPGLDLVDEAAVLSAEGETGNAADDVTSFAEERPVESEAKLPPPAATATEANESKQVAELDIKKEEPSSGSKRKTNSAMTSSKASAGTEGGQAADEDQQGDSAPNNEASRANEPAKRKKKSQNEKIEELKVQVLELREQNQALKKKAGKLASDKSKILTCLTNLSMLVGQKKVENEMLKTKIAQLQEVVCEEPGVGVNFQMKQPNMPREDCRFPQDMLSVFSQEGQAGQCR